jgi:site-specific recombinase XerD
MTMRPYRFRSPLAKEIQQFLAHKRALARRFDVEERALRLFDRFLAEQGVRVLKQITPDLLDAFLASRPRKTPRSYNHLLGTLARLFRWIMDQGRLKCSPLRAKPRRQTGRRIPFLFDASTARRFLEAAGKLPDNSRAPMRGLTYRTIFALLYGLGLRVGEVTRLLQSDVDFDRHLLLIRLTKFSKNRLVPFGPRLAGLLRQYLDAKRERFGNSYSAAPLFSFVQGRNLNPSTISQVFQQLFSRLNLTPPLGTARPRAHDMRHNADCRIMPTSSHGTSFFTVVPPLLQDAPLVDAA